MATKKPGWHPLSPISPIAACRPTLQVDAVAIHFNLLPNVPLTSNPKPKSCSAQPRPVACGGGSPTSSSCLATACHSGPLPGRKPPQTAKTAPSLKNRQSPRNCPEKPARGVGGAVFCPGDGGFFGVHHDALPPQTHRPSVLSAQYPPKESSGSESRSAEGMV